MFSANQIMAHLVGDYILQSDWMVKEKGSSNLAALVHVVFYTLPFVLITQEPIALGIIAGTHFVIDRWRLARVLIWAKNRPWPGSLPWAECRATGYPPNLPVWMSTWLMILVDNILHLLINGVAIHYFG